MATKIWDAAAATPTGTHRIPADTSAAGSPTRYTVQQLADLKTSVGITANALGNVTGATSISLASGGIVTATATGNTTFTFDDPPVGATEWTLVLTNGGAFTITWPTTTWAGATAPTLTASGVDVIRFTSPNGGTTWYGWHEVDAPPLSPSGSSGQFQYNDASALGAANLWWIDANTLAQRNSTNAQCLRINDTYTDDSNQAYLEINPGAAGDWMQIRAVTAGTAADNYGVAFSPSGTGAISAHVPDSTSVGGNSRGANAVDWQTSRTAATHVASQPYATISGGRSNTASDQYATVAGGNFSAASAERSTVGGGEFNLASGAFSTIAGGYLCTASGSFSVASGHSSSTRGLQGAVSHSSSPRSAAGDAQVISQSVRRTTTDATPVSLAANATPAAATVMVLPANSTLVATATVGARDSSGNSAGWIAQALFKRDGSGNTTRLGTATVTAIGTPDAAVNTATIDLVANDTLEAAEIQVTGVAATTIYWVGELKCVQIA